MAFKCISEEEHHVHFEEAVNKDDFESDNSIKYQKATSGINVHLGFLQVNHRYRINLNIPDVLLSEFSKDKSTLSLTTDPESIPNIHCKYWFQFKIQRDNAICYPQIIINSIRHVVSISWLAGKLTEFKENSSETKSRYEAEIGNFYFVFIFLQLSNYMTWFFNVFVLEFFAHKEKLLKEELILIYHNEPDQKIKFIFTARVLGRGKGCPMLRNGIHCTAIETGDEESDASDWQGFSRTESDEL